MKKQCGIGKAIGSAIIGGALMLAALPGGAMQADNGWDALSTTYEGMVLPADDRDVDGGYLHQSGTTTPSHGHLDDLGDWQSNYGATVDAAAGTSDSEWKYVNVRR